VSVVWVKNPETAQRCGYLGQKYPYTEISLITASAALSWQDQAWPRRQTGQERAHAALAVTFLQLLKDCWPKNHFRSCKANERNVCKQKSEKNAESNRPFK